MQRKYAKNQVKIVVLFCGTTKQLFIVFFINKELISFIKIRYLNFLISVVHIFIELLQVYYKFVVYCYTLSKYAKKEIERRYLSKNK